MNTTAVVSEDTTTIVQDDRPSYDWWAVLAGAIIAASVSFFLILVGAAMGLTLATGRNVSGDGSTAFLTLGAIYFVAAEALGFAIGGHVTGRLMRPMAADSEEENFRADAHGLGVWGLAVVFGLAVASLTAANGLVAGTSRAAANTPAAYWADKLFAASPAQSADAGNPQQTNLNTPTGGAASAPTYADLKAEAGRLLVADPALGGGTERAQLIGIVSGVTGLDQGAAANRINQVETDMRNRARQAADAARRGALFLAFWTAVALLFGAVVCVVATLSTHWHELETRRG